jgi:DNA-binding PadR family transcriptional regulator
MATVSKNQKMNRVSNFMEELAEGVLEELLSKKKENFSRGALEDIKALALNRLWPMYTTTDSGRDYLRQVVEQDKIEKDVIREILAAIDIVRSNPR